VVAGLHPIVDGLSRLAEARQNDLQRLDESAQHVSSDGSIHSTLTQRALAEPDRAGQILERDALLRAQGPELAAQMVRRSALPIRGRRMRPANDRSHGSPRLNSVQ
jgi:hypothetical protein